MSATRPAAQGVPLPEWQDSTQSYAAWTGGLGGGAYASGPLTPTTTGIHGVDRGVGGVEPVERVADKRLTVDATGRHTLVDRLGRCSDMPVTVTFGR